MINLYVGANGSVGLLTLEGKITVHVAEELKSTLLFAMSVTDRLYLNAGLVSAVDISCFQILCSAHRASVKMKKRLAWAGSLPELFKKTALDAGFVVQKGCPFDACTTCLWMRICDD